MKSLVAPQVVILVSFVLASSLLITQLVEAEQPPTVFVLDTSDSDSNVADSLPPTTTTRAPPDEAANTKIIGDDADQQQAKKQSSSSSSPYEQKQSYQRPNKSNQQANSSTTNCTNPRHQHHSNEHDNQHDRQESSSSSAQLSGKHQRDDSAHCSQNDEAPPAESSSNSSGKHRDSTSSRNLDTESELVASKNQRERSQRSTTNSPASSYDGQASNQKKIQERLLISISNSDEESDHQHQPPKVSAFSTVSSLLGIPNDESQASSHNQQQNGKRKPSITISIQDPHRPNGSAGGMPAVILRPGEDGQSIVISTVNGHGASSQQTQKIKPSSNGDISIPIALVNSAINSNNQRDPPYKEPANSPLLGILQRPPVTTTRRPQQDSYQNQDPIRPPPTSTLTDERPQRPSNNLDEPVATPYETTSRPHSKPAQQQQPGDDSEPSNQNSSHDTSVSSPQDNKPKYPLNERNCGIMHETRIVGGEEANPADFMWMVAIIKSKPRDGDPRPFCGGSLITRRHILTAAHCLENLAPRDVLVRLGSYDFEDTASSSSSDYAIDQFRVPAQYSKKTHVADIAIMRLKTPLSLTDNYKTVCMPQPRRSYVGALGTVTGYGSQSQTFRRAAPKLRQVTVPIWENRKCSIVYKKNLTESFLCAGYEEGGKDACQGDSGGPLMTDGPEQKMMLVGVVSHGIGCGAPGYPGVYTRTSTFLDWIEKNTRE